jgi:hypothetical protein
MRKQTKNTFTASKRKKYYFCFASFRFEAKMMAIFAFFVSFSLRFIFFSLQIPTLCIDAKQAKKALFFASMEKKCFFRIRFASFRFKAKMTAHYRQEGASGPPKTKYLHLVF